MPCHVRLPRLRDSHHVHNAVHGRTMALRSPRAFYATRPRQVIPVIEREIPLEEPTSIHEAAKVAAEKRLNKTINPNDLSATLEAHRESNRTSVFRTVAPTKLDPETIRPSFLPKKPHADYRRRIFEGTEEQQSLEDGANKELEVLQGHIRRVAINSPGDSRRVPKRDYISLNSRLHDIRTRILKRHEPPGLPVPQLTDRGALFEVLGRARSVIRTSQRIQKRAGKVLSLPQYVLDYSKTAVPMAAPPKTRRHVEPWARRPKRPYTVEKRLELEMNLFGQWMAPTRAEEAAKRVLYDLVQEIVKKTTPGWETEMFGSRTTGLALITSDMDIRIFPTEEEKIDSLDLDQTIAEVMGTNLIAPESTTPKPNISASDTSELDTQDPTTASDFTDFEEANLQSSLEDPIAVMHDIHSYLKSLPDFDLVVMHQGRYPLVGAMHIASGQSIQIVYSKTTIGAKTTIERYLSEYPTLKPLYMVVKTMFDRRSLSNVWTGGFGSYSIFMMVVASLKHKSSKTDGVVKQFLDFLEFYVEFDVENKGISIEPPLIFEKKLYPSEEERELRKDNPVLTGRLRISQPRFYATYWLCLQDPADPYNDLGKNSLAIKDVQATFELLRSELIAFMADRNTPSINSALLGKVIGRCDVDYDERRTKVELFGEQFLEHGKGEEEGQTGQGKDVKKNTGPVWLS